MRRSVLLTSVVLGAFAFSSCNDSGFNGNNAAKKPGESKSSGSDGSGDGANNSDTANGGDGGASEGGFPPGSEAAETAAKLPKFGMLVNDLKCALCHVKVRGDVASTKTVDPFWMGTRAEVVGTWFAAQAFNGTQGSMPGTSAEISVTVTGGIKTNYTGPEVPKAFPTLDYTALRTKMKGSVSWAGATIIDKVKDGNVVLTGTTVNPIVISKDVLISGDLVISGSFKGNGTIYVSGNVYIPSNLRATKSPFPYPDDAAGALARANQIAADLSFDGLGIVTKRSIFLGDLEKREAGENGYTVYNHGSTPADRKYEPLGTLNVYNWFSGGKAGFDSLYSKAYDCTTGATERIGSIDLIDAFLMAENTIAGVSRHASYSIRGGIIADHMHIINGAQRCFGKGYTSPVHGQSGDWSYVEYDYRLATGKYLIMEHVADVIGRE